MLIYHPDAEAELIAGASFYEGRVAGLGRRFLDDVELVMKDIQTDPMRWRVLEGDIRRYLMKRFPYAIYYRALSEEIRVLAIKHHSRHPDYWRYRKE